MLHYAKVEHNSEAEMYLNELLRLTGTKEKVAVKINDPIRL